MFFIQNTYRTVNITLRYGKNGPIWHQLASIASGFCEYYNDITTQFYSAESIGGIYFSCIPTELGRLASFLWDGIMTHQRTLRANH